MSYLSTLRQLHIANNYPDPKTGGMAKLEQVMRGIKRHQAQGDPSSRDRMPITPLILRQLRIVWERENSDHNNIMLWAASCLWLSESRGNHTPLRKLL